MRFISRQCRTLLMFLLTAAVIVVSGCGEKTEQGHEPEPTTAPTPAPAQVSTAAPASAAKAEPAEIPSVRIGSMTFSGDAVTVDLRQEQVNFEELLSASDMLPNVTTILLGSADLSPELIGRLTAAYPGAEISWELTLFGETISSETEELSFPDIRSEDVPELCAALEMLPNLRILSLLPENGVTPLNAEELALVSAACPDTRIDCSFSLFGQIAGPETEELRYSGKKIGDAGIDVFRAALPYLHSLKLLRLYACGINDNDAMAALREDFPDVNVVWSIEIAGSKIMTDTTLIHTPLLRDKHVHLLQYFPDVLYFDIGHNKYLTSIDFLKYLPKLQVFIMAITQIKDISPLANCPDLEYLELFTTPIEDISVLSSLTKLEYLNIGTMHNLSDISPVFGLKNLKMVRICGSSFDHVSREQVAELKAALPDCYVSDGPGDPTTSGGWRYDEHHKYTPRYELLRQQMLYYRANWKDRVSNSPSAMSPKTIVY